MTRSTPDPREVQVLEADTEEVARRCWPLFRLLRANIDDEEEFVRRWRAQRPEGYQIVYVEVDGRVAAAAGFRLLHTMAWGRVLYLDDLIAGSEYQGNGLGALLLRWLQEEARRRECDEVHLDTGYQRQAAHRTYLRNGFELSCHHLSWKVEPSRGLTTGLPVVRLGRTISTEDVRALEG
jgi:GNAT superfamily N-acetyltransferase